MTNDPPFTVDVSFTLRRTAGAAPQDPYEICDVVGQWLQWCAADCQREGLKMTGGRVEVRPVAPSEPLDGARVIA
jgi:hypothetical protein